jgi:hypothetical protein
LPAFAARNWRPQSGQTGSRCPELGFVVAMNNGLHRVDLGMAGKSRQRCADHRLATDLPVLLGHFAAGAVPAACGNNHRRNFARHAFRLPLPQRATL